MKNSALTAGILFLLISASFLIFPFWHSFPLINIENVGLYLESYPAEFTEDVCFTVGFYVPKQSQNTNPQYKIYINNELKEYGNFLLVPGSKSYCLKDVPNQAVIKYELDSIEVFFHTEKVQEIPETKIKILDINSEGILLQTENTEKYIPLKILFNGEIKYLITPSEGVSFETLNIKEETKVSILYKEQILKERTIQPKTKPFPPIYGILLFCLVFLSYLLFLKGDLYERIAKSLTAIFAYIILTVFILNLLNLLSLFSFLLVFSLQLLLLLKKRNSLVFPKFTLTETFVIVFFISIALFFHLFTYTHLTYWNGFYERQSDVLAENFSLQTFDSLSYLGRAMTYIPGYFFLNASFQWLFTDSFPILLLFADLFFLFAFASLGSKLKLENKSLPFVLLVATSLFILTGLTLSPRHAISLSLFAVALSFLIDKKPIQSGITLAISAFIQIPILVFFPVFYLLMFAEKKDIKNLLKTILIAIILFALFFLPNLISFGMPYEVKSEDWGYLIKHSPEYLIGDIPALIAFFFIFFAYEYTKTKKKLSFFSGRLAIATAIGFLIQLFISYRWNIMTAISLSAFIAYEFPKRIFDDKQSRILILIILGMIFAPLLTTMSYYSMAGISMQPISTLGMISSSNDNVLSDPLFSHSIAYISQRKTLSDLYVEYADEEKLSDTYSFLKTSNKEILEKYNISYILNQRDIIHSQAIGAKPLDNPLDFPFLDKVYNNGFIFIHKNRFLE